jgi:hypothetical protein
MKRLLVGLSVIAALTSCSKSNAVLVNNQQQQTKVFATWRTGSDNMLHSSALYCYPGDEKRRFDTVLYYNSTELDTTYMFADNVTYAATGRVDSSFVFAGQLVNLVGAIYHREYNGAVKINKIEYGNIH